MTTFVLDSSTILRLLDSEPGADRVEEILTAHMNQSAEAIISAIQWGEVAGLVRKKHGVAGQIRALEDLAFFQMRVVPATEERAVLAATIKEDRKFPYADAFALELAIDTSNSVLVTADYDFKKVDDMARIEFLPIK